METLLIFLAIIAIQVIAAYLKQKKKAEKRVVKPQNLPEYEPEYIEEEEYEDSSDPFKEIREAMGLPPAEKTVLQPEPKHDPKPEPEYRFEGISPKTQQKSEPVAIVDPPKPEHKIQIDLNKPEHGILWAAILQQPRYRVKWKSPCSH